MYDLTSPWKLRALWDKCSQCYLTTLKKEIAKVNTVAERVLKNITIYAILLVTIGQACLPPSISFKLHSPMYMLMHFSPPFQFICHMASIIIIPAAFIAVSTWLYYLASIAPTYSENDYALGFPGSLEDLKSLSKAFEFYRKENSGYVILLFSSAYLYKQTFAIPGSVFLVSTSYLIL